MAKSQEVNLYQKVILDEMKKWQEDMVAPPSLFGELTRKTQSRINRFIPEKIHKAMTATIKQITKAVIFGAGFTTREPRRFASVEELENEVRDRIKVYRTTAAAEGGITGAGGILLGIADFPLWLTLKMKLLFEIATHYGYDTRDFRERLYILHIFQLTFSDQHRRNHLYPLMADWKRESEKISDINHFDWRTFQIEYRDYIDLVKLLQLIPGIGAPIGALVNHRLTNKLGTMAMNAYRLRMVNEKKLLR